MPVEGEQLGRRRYDNVRIELLIRWLDRLQTILGYQRSELLVLGIDPDAQIRFEGFRNDLGEDGSLGRGKGIDRRAGRANKSQFQRVLKVEGLLQTRQQQVDVDRLAVAHGAGKDAPEIVPGPLTEHVGENLVDLPRRREDRSVFLVVDLQDALEPREPPRYVVQRAGLLIVPEHLSVLAQLEIAIPGHQPVPGVVSQRIHHQAALREHGLLLSHFALGKRKLKVLTHLLQQLPLDIRHVPAEQGDLVDRAIRLEVGHQLDHRLQQLGTVTVLPCLAEATQLVVRRRQHLQPLEGGHRQREVLLRVVQLLDVGCHLRDRRLRLGCAVAHVVNFLEQLAQVRLGGLDSLDAFRIGCDLILHQRANVVVEFIFVTSEGLGDRGRGGQRARVGEDGV